MKTRRTPRGIASTAKNGSAGQEEPPLRKRFRPQATDDEVRDCFGLSVQSETSREQLAGSYRSSAPYRHVAVSDLVASTLLRDVREEIVSHLVFTEKETDIYRVHQTGDLANISGLASEEASKIASLLKLRDALYSPYFRNFLQTVIGCGPLSGENVDMSINCYLNGNHLLIHDDVIGTRCISYILYLVDPDQTWNPESGGHLRLYPCAAPGEPMVDPSVAIPPVWNQLVMFAVQPGASFHDVEEVYSNDCPRLAISGWFHLPQRGEEGYVPEEQRTDSIKSSLKQLEDAEKCRTLDPPAPFFEDLTEVEALSPEDVQYLEKYITPALLKADSIQRLNSIIVEESAVEIPNFLAPDIAAAIKNQLNEEDSKPLPRLTTDVQAPWKVAAPPNKQRYLYLLDESNTYQSLLQIQNNLFTHSAFRRWLSLCTGLSPQRYCIQTRRFRPGSDYILATNYSEMVPRLEGTLCLTPTADGQNVWESGEHGGYETYMSSDEAEGADAAVYQGNDDSDDPDSGVLFSNNASWNTLHLAVRDSGVLKFIKYVNKSAPGSRYDVACQWTVKPLENAEQDFETNGNMQPTD